MRYSFIVALCLLSSFSQAQKFTNDQHNAGDWGEFGDLLYKNSMDGPVKQMKSYCPESETDSLKWNYTIKYQRNGRISYFGHGNSTMVHYEYTAKGDSVISSTVDASGLALKVNRQKSAWSESSLAPPVPDSVAVNAKGQVVFYAYNHDCTYSFYDSLGRKVLDSVPGSAMSMMHTIHYTYLNQKVVKKYTIGDEQRITLYDLDSHNNWHRSYFIDEKGKTKIIEVREIIYY